MAQRLDLSAPVPDIPASEDPHAAEFIGTQVDRHMNQGQAIIGPGLVQRGYQRLNLPPAIQGQNPFHRARPANLVHHHAVAGGELAAVLRYLQPFNGRHAPVIQKQDAAPGAVLDAVNEDLRTHRE